MSEQGPGFGIYVHWPFCLSKCPYCDFNSHVRAGVDHARWRAALLRELDHYAALTPRRTVTSIFFGGGTPSLMEPATVAAIIERVCQHWATAPGLEITLEANPTSVEAEKFVGFRAAGVNRISLGIQALDDASLKFLGRAHSAGEALGAIALAAQHFDRFSFDLIYARPGQTVAAWEAELRQALDHAVGHLSVYQLTIEEGTQFHTLHSRGAFAIPDEDLAGDLYEATQALLESAGLPAYEISNHARPGAECRHNLVYWRGHEYAGIGPGAHGRLNIGGVRYATETEKRPESWLMRVEASGHGLTVNEPLMTGEQADEYLLMGLRLAEGIDPERYQKLAGRALDEKRISILKEEGAIESMADGRLRVTLSGFPVLDAVVADLAA